MTLGRPSGSMRARDERSTPFEGPPEMWSGRLLQSLDEQKGLCERLDELSVRQSSLVAEGRGDAVIAVLGDRQRLIEKIIAINADLEPFRSEKDRLIGRLPVEARRGVESRIDAIGAIMDRIRERDDHDRAELERQRGAVADELAGMARARGAAAAYAGAGRHPAVRERSNLGERNG